MFFVGLICAVIFGYQFKDTHITINPLTLIKDQSLYTVTKVYDGDTIEVDMLGNKEKIRMIGVNTPETHDPRKPVECYGQAASDFTKQQLEGKRVRLQADPINQNRDRYNRLLRYVYLPDGTLYNAELIRQGYGFALTAFPFTKARDFQELEKTAKTANIGLWGSCQI